MDKWSWIFLIGGVILGGVAVYLVLKPPPAYTYKAEAVPKYRNKEIWSWTDWRGRQRKLTVEREVKAYV